LIYPSFAGYVILRKSQATLDSTLALVQKTPTSFRKQFSDTFEYYAIVFDIENEELIGINKAQKKLFDALFTMEMEAMPERDGRLLIISDNKYGFVNHKGEIVIEPQYSCAESFYNGRARVSNQCRRSKDEHYMWESDHWIYIDKCGNEFSLEKK
jgi:hypothetical protein